MHGSMRTRISARGFTLVELMVAMSAGLVVIGAIVAFTVATAQSSTTNIRSTRVMQYLRSSMDLIEREIRRSGFDENAIKFVGTCVSAGGTCPIGNFNQIVISTSSCIIVSYDTAANSTPGTPGAGATYHGFRLVQKSSVGVIQASLGSATAPSCGAAANSTDWTDVTDPKIVNVTNLAFSQPATVGGCVQQSNTGMWLVVQDVLVQVTGQWVDPSNHLTTSRSIEESVRVKNDIVAITKPSVCT